MEIWLSSEKLYSGPVVGLRVGTVRLADGTIAKREVVEHPGGAAIVPVYNDSVVLARQFRIAIGQEILEIPAGKLEGDADPELRARHELEEETGYRAGRLVPMGCIYASVGYTSERIHMYLAFDLEPTNQRLDEDERIEPVLIPLEGLEERIARHEFEDSKTYIGLIMLLDYLKRAGCSD